MLPPWMNLYAILTMSTVLVSIVGVNEMMSLTRQALSAENRSGLLLAFYSYVLFWFFLYCYPIARWTTALERRFANEHEDLGVIHADQALTAAREIAARWANSACVQPRSTRRIFTRFSRCRGSDTIVSSTDMIMVHD